MNPRVPSFPMTSSHLQASVYRNFLIINNEINRKVKKYSINKSDLNTYYNVGKLLLAAGNQYGESIIKEYSIKLTEEFGSGYSQRNLRNMRRFYKVSQK